MKRNSIMVLRFICPLLGALLLCAFPARPAHAQDNVIGYRCDQARDWIVITYGVPATGFNAENFTGTQTIQKTCGLRNGTYEVDISTAAEPGAQGICAGSVAEKVKIFSGNLYQPSSQYQYATELGGICINGASGSASQIIFNDRTGEFTTSSISSSTSG